ncbi:MAG: SAM-dependent methyltransferase [Paludibacter sp.]|nr:MAG: SAM-dependent methyltransferase [Paludibacter sp.]
MAALYLFPTLLGDTGPNDVLPAANTTVLATIRHFIVEEVRTARRFIRKCLPQANIDEMTFFVLNQHTRPEEVASFLTPLQEGLPMGLRSEAGCPAIADPGADVVALAQQLNLKVVPLVGPSSILLALMASGFNGQSFAFNGYLPVQLPDKQKILKKWEHRIYNEHQSQLFIETPYRNNKTLADLLALCPAEMKLCIAADITTPTEFIRTLTIRNWKNQLPDLTKRPTLFILYK